jgi:hypothetical protein
MIGLGLGLTSSGILQGKFLLFYLTDAAGNRLTDANDNYLVAYLRIRADG